jgi:hypothetical protein
MDVMVDLVALDLVRQQRRQLERRAEQARLARVARPRKKHGDAPGG